MCEAEFKSCVCAPHQAAALSHKYIRKQRVYFEWCVSGSISKRCSDESISIDVTIIVSILRRGRKASGASRSPPVRESSRERIIKARIHFDLRPSGLNCYWALISARPASNQPANKRQKCDQIYTPRGARLEILPGCVFSRPSPDERCVELRKLGRHFALTHIFFGSCNWIRSSLTFFALEFCVTSLLTEKKGPLAAFYGVL